MGRSKLPLLHTAIVEVESIINSRPLSYISSGDLEEPLTPSNLILIGRRVLNLPDNLGVLLSDPEDEEFTVSPNQLGDRVKNVSESLNYFWDRWRTEYLAELREAHRQSKCNLQKGTPVSVGDIVFVHDEGLPHVLETWQDRGGVFRT